jgi:hypothetical protein
MKEHGTCPKCHGTKRISYAGVQKHTSYIKGYNAADNSVVCDNCGGQTTEGKASGLVFLNKNKEPCLHDYTEKVYYRYTCKHCGSRYEIDSGE